MSGCDDPSETWILPTLFSSISSPKAEELVATPHRHGGKSAAEEFFLDGMIKVFRNLTTQCQPGSIITIFYAFRQSETETVSGNSSTGWETFLEAVLEGVGLARQWRQVRTELHKQSGKHTAKCWRPSIILVCRPRAKGRRNDLTRRQFLCGEMLNEALPLLALDRHDLARARGCIFAGRASGFVTGDHRPRYGDLQSL